MGLSAKAGTFALTTSVEQQEITGVGFEPEIVLFFGSENTADGVIEDHNIMTGAAISDTSRVVVTHNDEDASNPSDSSRSNQQTECIRLTPSGSASSSLVLADFVSMDASDGFTIDVTDVTGATAYRMGYLALAGTDLTNVAIGNFTTPAGSGEQEITGVGFQPDSVIFFSNNRADDQNDNDYSFAMGFAVATDERAWIGGASTRNVSPSQTDRAQRTDGCIGLMKEDGTSVESEADFTSWEADGFKITWSAASSGSLVFYIALKGGQYSVGSVTTTTGADVATSDPGFTPAGGIFASYMNAASGSIQTGINLSLGIASDTDEMFVVGGTSEDAQTTTDADQFQDDALVYASYDYNQTLTGSADLKSWDENGFTLEMIDGDPSGYEMIYWVVGADAAAVFSVSVSDSITVAESLSVTVSAPQIDTSQATTVSESIAASVSAPQINTSQAITIAETVGKLLISDIIESQAVTVSESIALALDALQIDTSQAVTIAETIARQLVSDVVESQSVTVSESVAATLDDLQIDTSQAITVSESVSLSIGAAGAFALSATQSVTVAESIALSVSNPQIDSSQAVTVAESVKMAMADLAIAASQSITVSESVSLSVVAGATDLSLSVSQGITIAESVTVSVVAVPTLSISILQRIAVRAERITVDPLAIVTAVIQALVISESGIFTGPGDTVYDITLSESLLHTITMSESQLYGVSMSDAAIIDVSISDITETQRSTSWP